MQRFRPDDRVFILPKYAHLYPENFAVVVGVTADPFRPMFNEYRIQFADHFEANIFEFQVIEDLANYKTSVASIVFASHQETRSADSRAPVGGRQIILQTPAFHLEMGIYKSKSLASILGRTLKRDTNEVLKDIDVRLMKEAMPVAAVVSDTVGVFRFRHVPHGSLNILVTIHQFFHRILGAFSV